MSESAHGFKHPGLAASSTEHAQGFIEHSSTLPGSTRRRQQSQQQRQLLSCTKCRERKVKCDRMKPCSACCARGVPKECVFKAENGDYEPIQQSYEIRRLRTENLRLKERLRACNCRISIEDDGSDFAASPDSAVGDRPLSATQKRRAARQRRFQGAEWSDSIYFGSPGLANVIKDFATINLTPASTQSLAHIMPRGQDMYTHHNPSHFPFATLFAATPDVCIPELLRCLPAREDLFECLGFFEKRVHVCAFPHVPLEIAKSEVERFLSDEVKNATMCPDMLALLFSSLALGSQFSAWDKFGGDWKGDAAEAELKKWDVYIAAAMQALRLASFMHRPTLLGIQALIMIGPFLTNSGRFLDAWTLFGTTVRLAHSIGLHRHPKYLDPAPPSQRECSIRQTLWWWMLHMDQEYSMTLGRPLGISGLGDCPPPLELTTDRRMLRLGECMNDFTILARQILSSDRLSNAKIDEFTDQLKHLLDTMPEMLHFHESWLDDSKEIPEWPLGVMSTLFYCKTHTYLILLNQQRVDKSTPSTMASQLVTSMTKARSSSFHPVDQPTSTQPSPAMSPNASLRGRALVLSSSENLLTAFVFFYRRVPEALICWSIGQQAFNACMILLLDALETGDLSRIEKMEKAYAVFTQLDNHGVHGLAALAVERVSLGLEELRRMEDQTHQGGRAQSFMSTRGGKSAWNTKMQGAEGSEATQGSGVMHDTVMGNTGMLLLEDPGLQSFVPEAFAPLTWTRGGDHVQGVTLGRTIKEKQKEKQGEQTQHIEARSNVSNIRLRDARSSGDMQGVHGSAPGSAVRHATFSNTPSQEQPQGLASPRSPPPSSASITEYYQSQNHALSEPVSGLHQLPPPHLRHHSYPSLHPYGSVALAPQPSRFRTQTGRKKGNAAAQGRRADSGAAKREGSWDEDLVVADLEQLMPGFATPQHQLDASPTFTTSTTTASQLVYSTGHASVHPSWAARPAAPMSSGPEPALSLPYEPGRTYAIPALSLQSTQQLAASSPLWQMPMIFHESSAAAQSPNTISAPVVVDTEQVEMWQRLVSSKGATN